MGSESNSSSSSPSYSSLETPEDISHPLLGFTNTFVISSDSDQPLCEITNSLGLDPLRLRRPHHKSKHGCDQCRKRRVKCDEKYPRCTACTRRHEPCARRSESPALGTSPQRRTDVASRYGSVPCSISQAPLMETQPAAGMVNLLHMKLFHHFQRHTVQSLTFGPDIWENALQLSFNFESLMNTILCVSARHLSILNPDDPKYTAAANTHLSRALLLFRDDLSTTFTSSNIDAFMMTAALLQYEMWTNTDFTVLGSDGNVSYDPAEDRVFKHSMGVTPLFLNCVPHFFNKPSPFVPHIRHSPRSALVKAAQLSKVTLDQFVSYFAYDTPLHPDLFTIPFDFIRGPDLAEEEYWSVRTSEMAAAGFDGIKKSKHWTKAYADVIPRLCLILSFIPEAEAPGGLRPEIERDLSRYILSFAILCDPSFVSMVLQRDAHALVLLYHFYRAVRILFPPDKYWWAHRRACCAEMVLKEHLIKEFARERLS